VNLERKRKGQEIAENGPDGSQTCERSIGIEAGRMGGIITPDTYRSLYFMEARHLLSACLGALPSRSSSSLQALLHA